MTRSLFQSGVLGGRIGKHCSNVATALFLYNSDELPLPEGVEHHLHPELHFCHD